MIRVHLTLTDHAITLTAQRYIMRYRILRNPDNEIEGIVIVPTNTTEEQEQLQSIYDLLESLAKKYHGMTLSVKESKKNRIRKTKTAN